MVERRRIWLVTVVETWGSAPRVPGALLCLCEDGAIVGSVSGGCVEDDLVERLRTTAPITRPTLLTYGVTRGEATRFGLPCGGTLRLVQEPLQGEAWVDEVLARASQHELIARRLDLSSGRSQIESMQRTGEFSFDGRWMRQPFGPRWRLLVVGAGQLSQLVASMATALDFDVTCCDTREEYAASWHVDGVSLDRSMSDDLVVALELDAHSAVVALSHDPIRARIRVLVPPFRT